MFMFMMKTVSSLVIRKIYIQLGLFDFILSSWGYFICLIFKWQIQVFTSSHIEVFIIWSYYCYSSEKHNSCSSFFTLFSLVTDSVNCWDIINWILKASFAEEDWNVSHVIILLKNMSEVTELTSNHI
jgi:hypothetical protein